MNLANIILLAVIAAIAVALVVWAINHFFSAEARWERRRRRSNAPIQSTTRRPSIRLSVQTRKQRRK
jgi:uncharacterized protein HemY